MTEDTKKLDKAERDAMRKANPLIDELLYDRYWEADNACYGTLGDAASVRHGERMDQLQDEISEIVGEENFDAIWDDYENER